MLWFRYLKSRAESVLEVWSDGDLLFSSPSQSRALLGDWTEQSLLLRKGPPQRIFFRVRRLGHPDNFVALDDLRLLLPLPLQLRRQFISACP